MENYKYKQLKQNKMKTKQKFIVRCQNAGVFFGEVKSKTNTTITMTNVRKIHYWDGAAAVEEIAVNGVNNNSRITLPIEIMELKDWIQILPCTKKSEEILNKIVSWTKS